jgi:hypothetical protein
MRTYVLITHNFTEVLPRPTNNRHRAPVEVCLHAFVAITGGFNRPQIMASIRNMRTGHFNELYENDDNPKRMYLLLLLNNTG